MNSVIRQSVLLSIALGAIILSSLVNAKPGASVSIQGPQAYFMDGHSSKEINLQIRVPKKSGQLRLTLNYDDALSMSAGEETHMYELDGTEETVLLPLSVSSTIDGKFYIMLNAELTIEGGRPQGRSMGVSVTVGIPGLEARKKPGATGQARKLPLAKEKIY